MRIFTKVYSVILFVSIIAYIFYLLDISIPYTIMRYEYNTGYPSFKNYIFLIIRNETEFFSRFQSIFGTRTCGDDFFFIVVCKSI